MSKSERGFRQGEGVEREREKTALRYTVLVNSAGDFPTGNATTQTHTQYKHTHTVQTHTQYSP